MKLFTIGFTQKNAKEFFSLLEKNGVDCLVDVRLNNVSQLAGFTKSTDLEYFLQKILGVQYLHSEHYAPTKDILDKYRKGEIDWTEYERRYTKLISDKKIETLFFKTTEKYNNVCLLCSEPTPEHCHRRLMAEYLQNVDPTISIIHL